MTEPIRIAVTGAAGRISYALLFRIASGSMFGPDRPVALSLHDVPEMSPLIDATMMELDDSAFPLLRSMRASTDPAEAFAGADWVFLIGSAPYVPGMNRAEAVQANGPIFVAQGRAINEAAKNARVLVVANPCNTNCLVGRTTARDVPTGHWYAMTRLDQNRGRVLLAQKANVPIDQVNRVTAWGNHSPSVFVDFHNAWVGDRPAHEVIHDRDWVRNQFEPAVANRGQELFKLRGSNPAGSAAQAILSTVRSLTTPTPYLHHFSAGVLSDGSYGIPHDLVFSLPLRTDDGLNHSVVQTHYLDDHAQRRIAENVTELQFESAAASEFLSNRIR